MTVMRETPEAVVGLLLASLGAMSLFDDLPMRLVAAVGVVLVVNWIIDTPLPWLSRAKAPAARTSIILIVLLYTAWPIVPAGLHALLKAGGAVEGRPDDAAGLQVPSAACDAQLLVAGTLRIARLDRCITESGCAGTATALRDQIDAGAPFRDRDLHPAIVTLRNAADAPCVYPLLKVVESLREPTDRASGLQVVADDLCARIGAAAFGRDRAAAGVLDRHGVTAWCP